MGFPGTWMTESESVVYRVVPKCACSTIGQIMYFSDHGEFFDGDIHDATAGRLSFEGTPVDALPPEARRRYQVKVQMIFQDPMSSLNPRMRVQDTVGEAPLVHGLVERADLADYVDRMLARVGLEVVELPLVGERRRSVARPGGAVLGQVSDVGFGPHRGVVEGTYDLPAGAVDAGDHGFDVGAVGGGPTTISFSFMAFAFRSI